MLARALMLKFARNPVLISVLAPVVLLLLSHAVQVHKNFGPVLSSPVSSCPTANVDVFLVTHKADFPLTSFVIRSLQTFMPCRGITHILVDEADVLSLNAWVDVSSESFKVHPLVVPEKLSFLPGYIAQAWAMMWADKIIQSETADFIMFLDTDAVLGAPVTCRSLFDKEGKIYVAGWSMNTQQQFARCVSDMVGP